jgi:anti-sigma B factor antagonist
MEISEKTGVDKWVVIRISGRVDAETSETLEKAFLARIESGVLFLAIDLSEVSYISSAGLRAFLVALKSLQKKGGEVSLINPQPNVLEVLEMSGFTTLFPILKDTGSLI